MTLTIRNDATPVSTAKFTVSNTSAQVISVPLLMNNQKIQLLGAPVDVGDATRKDYVDNADALKLNLTGGILSGLLTATSIIKTGGLTTEFLKANGDIDNNTYLTTASIGDKLSIDGSIAMTGSLNMGNQAINNSGTVSATSLLSREVVLLLLEIS